ncbi:MAG TPA: VC0807 family protein [Ktedonobacterales bacterium]|nr:VC0807 family protein [Ktedonobacterales bacterium]
MPGSHPPDSPLPPIGGDASSRTAWQQLPGMLRRMLPMLVLDGALPLLLYLLLRPRFAATSVVPLAVAVLFPLLGNALNLVRHRRLDTFGLLVVLSLGASLAVLLLGGNQRLLLITRELVMPVMGLACLVSLTLPKPLAFYMVRQVLTGDDLAPGAAFDALWRYPSVRSASRLMTLVWGLAMGSEFVVRIVLVLTLSVAQVLVLSPVVMMAVGLGLGVWNVAYGVRVFHRIRLLTRRAEPPILATQAPPSRA